MARFSFTQGSEMLSGLKSKLGLSGGDSRHGHSDYDDYEVYDEDNYEEYDDYGPEDYDDQYEKPVSSTSRRGTRNFEPTRPRLVSFEDVRASTLSPDPLSNDPLAARHVVTTSDERTRSLTRDFSRSASTASSSRIHSSGYNSLFESTSNSDAGSYDARQSSRTQDDAKTSAFGGVSVPADPSIPVFTPTRSVVVLKPISYDEVEQIAKALKAGDAVVLQLMSTQSTLSKRILDFSFGVSSALDARVECIADKVFVITRGSELSDEERTKLRNQGVY